MEEANKPPATIPHQVKAPELLSHFRRQHSLMTDPKMQTGYRSAVFLTILHLEHIHRLDPKSYDPSDLADLSDAKPLSAHIAATRLALNIKP